MNQIDLRDVTGSQDAEYDSNDLKWGIAAPLAATGSVTTTGNRIIWSIRNYRNTK